MKRLFFQSCVLAIVLASGACRRPVERDVKVIHAAVLVLTETQGFRHSSIESGMAMFQQYADEWSIQVSEAKESSVFTPLNLEKYSMVVLLNTTGDVFGESEQQVLRTYIEDGGSLLAIHAAADAEYDWDWYGVLLGGRFQDHPEIQRATCNISETSHASTDGLPDNWERTDEWYNFKNLQPDNRVVVTIDETTYTGGTHGAQHPISWYRQVGNGKVFYTAMGHTEATYSEPLFIAHIKGAVKWLVE